MGDVAALTPKQAEVLDLVRERLSNAEIAQRLFVSERTVESHVAAILRKLQVPNRRALARPFGPGQMGNLPQPLTSFVGRQRELAQLADLLARRRVVTLVGTPGAGKTRLAVEAAAASTECPDGAWFVDLASVTTDHGVAEKVLAVLGGRQTPGRSAHDTLTGMARDRSYLVVLDNCEHLLSGAAWVAGVLAAAAPDIRVLATSRAPLELVGEVVFPVQPLETEDAESDASRSDAVQLLVDRARDAGASVDLDADAATVLRLCRRLDGLPLALELIAPRLRAFTPAHLVELLDHRFELAAASGAGRPRRHQTLRAAIEWSYDLLVADERELFARLSVFAGSFELSAAAAVCADERLPAPRVLDLLPRLVDRSLVTVEPGDGAAHRYRLLESLREFAAERLDPAAARAVQDRHAAFYLEVAEDAAPKLHSAHGIAVRDRLWLDHDQLLHALDWSLNEAPDRAVRFVAALSDFWSLADVACTGIQWADRVLAVDAGTPADRARALIGAAALTSAADAAAACEYGRAALELARTLADPELVAQAEATLVEPHAYLGEAQVAAELADDAIRHFRTTGDARSIASAEAALSFVTRCPEALDLLDHALDILTLVGDVHRAANVHYVLADRYLRELGDADRALPHATRARELALDIGSRHEQTHADSILAEIDLHRGAVDSADGRARRCLDAFERLGDHRCVTAMTFVLARCAAARGDADAALRLLRSVLALANRATQARTVPLALDLAASLLVDRAPDAAFVCACAAEARADSFGLGPRPDRVDPKRLRPDGDPAAAPKTLDAIAAILDEALRP